MWQYQCIYFGFFLKFKIIWINECNDADRNHVKDLIYSRLQAHESLNKKISCCNSDNGTVLPPSGNVCSYKQFIAIQVNYSSVKWVDGSSMKWKLK